MKPTNIHLSIRRWFDKTCGNSYFSGVVYADGLEVCRLPFQYGSGSHPEAVALFKAEENGVEFSGNGCYLGSACRDSGIRYTQDDCDVKKRECVAFGREKVE